MKKRLLILFLSCILFFSLFASKRVALVIGNGDYQGIPLGNPVNDANDVAATLRELDFEVFKITNLNKREMEEAAKAFEKKITSKDVALFYYSGHGMQVEGINYLIPLDANIDDENDVRYEAVELNRIIDKLEKAKLNIIILDACRDNPYKGFRSSSRGLAQISTKKVGTFIAYSTGPGRVAIDGTGRNSPYTKNLIAKMKTDMKIEDAFKEVRKSVINETDGKQVPWDASCLADDFYFCMSCAPKTTEPKQEKRTEQKENKQEIYENIDMVFVKGGTFLMGSNDGASDEKPVHSVAVSDFYIGKYKVTLEEFEKFIQSSGYITIAEQIGTGRIFGDESDYFKEKKDVSWRDDEYGNKRSISEKNYSVVHISWYDAIEFCNWLSQQNRLNPVYTIQKNKQDSNNKNNYDTFKWTVSANWMANGYRLPTEAEWEYAARGGALAPSQEKTQSIGSRNPNELGVYDMINDVWEWCWDWYDENYYKNSPNNNPKGPSNGSGRVYRGGGWPYIASGTTVSDRRYSDGPGYQLNIMGFRLARSIP